MLYEDNGRLIYRYDSETVAIEPWGKDGLRVRAAKSSPMPDENWALLKPERICRAKIAFIDGISTIQNGKITALVNEDGRIAFLNEKGETLLEEYARNRKKYAYAPGVVQSQDFASALNIEARQFKPILGGGHSLVARFESDPNERIYGMGQYQQPFLNLKGCELELAQRNSQASVPFAYSSRGYGFLWNNPAIGRVAFARNMTIWASESAAAMDYWITAGDSPSEILGNYALAAGSAPMMPDWAMGFWQCKLRYQTQDELLDVAREYKRRGVPLSVIVIDFFHWTRQGEWKFDPIYWPDPKAMADELRAMGVELMVSVWPTVDHKSENYREMEEKGYLVQVDRGQRIAMTFHGNTIHFDPTNPEARAYVWSKLKSNYCKCGIKAFWLDEAEPEYEFYDFDAYRYYLGPNLKIGNIYPLMYAKMVSDGMKQEGRAETLSLVRCAWAGSQRYGALVWSGDVDSSFRSLRNQLAAGLNMGLSGIAWWTTDIGGFHGGNPDDPQFRECFVRWFQFGAFSPVMRLHGDREPHSAPLGSSGGGLCGSGAANEIWSYGEEVYEICVKFINIRVKLQPYIKEIMRQASKSGAPAMRTLFFEFPQDERCWEVEDQYMFGPDILVAPVLHEKIASRGVYLPTGSDWLDAWTGEEHPGGVVAVKETPISRIPLLIRKGSNVSLV
ncbi:MAG: glycoside hydrolase family 31 protein [Clostridiales bacterium]|jgi:alpha-D-xyloside xylohydrolase|nr:glycoside hydrolase family 31 protein [Clostridiales bacterium]